MGERNAGRWRIRYGEGVLVGYRWYESRGIDVSFPFGHGPLYTTFEIGEPDLSTITIEPGERISVRVQTTNTGSRPHLPAGWPPIRRLPDWRYRGLAMRSGCVSRSVSTSPAGGRIRVHTSSTSVDRLLTLHT